MAVSDQYLFHSSTNLVCSLHFCRILLPSCGRYQELTEKKGADTDRRPRNFSPCGIAIVLNTGFFLQLHRKTFIYKLFGLKTMASLGTSSGALVLLCYKSCQTTRLSRQNITKIKHQDKHHQASTMNSLSIANCIRGLKQLDNVCDR